MNILPEIGEDERGIIFSNDFIDFFSSVFFPNICWKYKDWFESFYRKDCKPNGFLLPMLGDSSSEMELLEIMSSSVFFFSNIIFCEADSLPDLKENSLYSFFFFY